MIEASTSKKPSSKKSKSRARRPKGIMETAAEIDLKKNDRINETKKQVLWKDESNWQLLVG